MKHTPLMQLRTLAQWMAVCAVVLALPGCGGGASAPTATKQTGTPPTTSQQPPTGPQKPGGVEPTSVLFPRDLPSELGQHPPDTAQTKLDAENFKNSREYNPEAQIRETRGGPMTLVKGAGHLEMINAHWAHARGATGAGEIVAVTDSFLDVEEALDGIKFPLYDTTLQELGIKVGKTTLVARGKQWNLSYGIHGAQVASLIAATRDGGAHRGNMHGVAFDANLLLRGRRYAGNPGGKYVLDIHATTEQWDKDLAAQMFTLDYARKGGAAIANFSMSLGGKRLDDYTRETVREKFKHTAKELAQAHIPDAEKVIVVWGAANEGDTSTSLISGLGVHFPELQKHVLTVVALDKNGKIKVKDPNKKYDWGSNQCGRAKAFCLAAPGEGIMVPRIRRSHWEPDGYRLEDGTSVAAPLVSGGLALLRQYFSEDDADGTRNYQLGNTELVERLLATAYRGKNHPVTGVDYSDPNIYGHGMMDLDAATAPVGALATALSTDPNAQPFDASAFSLSGNAFGGAMRDALGGVKIAAFDELDAPFFFPLAAGVSHAPQISAGHSDTLHEHEVALGGAANASLALSLAAGELSAARIRRGNLWFSYGHHGGREAGLYFGDDGGNAIRNFGMNFSAENPTETVANAARHFRAPLAFASPYLSLVRDGPGLGWSQPLRSGARLGFSLMHGAPQFDHFANPGGARGLGALFDFRPNNTSLSLQAGAVREADGFLGARAQGNFGEISADTAFAGIGGDWAAMQNWRLLASAYLGHTTADTGDGMLRAADDIVSSAFSLGLARASLARRGDWLGLRLSQPLRAENGAAHLRIPAGRTKYREVLHRQHKLELTPSGRNLQVEAEYRVPFAGGTLRAGLGFDRHANHDRARDLEGFLRLGFERRF